MLRLGHLRPARMWVLLLLPLGSCTIQGVDGPPGLGEEGAPCSPSNRFACTEDGTAELVCREGWFVLSRLCDEPGCRVEELNGIPRILCGEVEADATVQSEVGDSSLDVSDTAVDGHISRRN